MASKYFTKVRTCIMMIWDKLDQTTINLLTILIGGAGLFSVMTKFYSPEVNYAFWDANPFLIKRDIIEGVLSWIFTFFALTGLLLQAYKEIYGDKITERKYKTQFYSRFLILGFMVMIGAVLMFARIGNVVARQIWQPRIVSSQKEAFESASFIIGHNGWRKDQVEGKDKIENPKKYIEANLKTAEENVLQIEKLLEVRAKTNSLPERLERLNKYFAK